MENLTSPQHENKIISGTVEVATPRIPLVEIHNTNTEASSSPAITTNVLLSGHSSSKSDSNRSPHIYESSCSSSHRTETPLKHSPSPAQSSKVKITPHSRTRRLQEMILERQQITPTAIYNPFDKCAEILHLPTVSPHLFKEVISPSSKEDNTFSWSIEQLAILKPTNIDTSPFNRIEIPSDPEYEKRAQEAIDRFFSASVVPSPWTDSSQPINLMSALLSSGASKRFGTPSSASPALLSPFNYQKKIVAAEIQPVSVLKVSVWCQTELTFPPNLPKEVEEAIAPFCTFTQDQTWQQQQQQEESDDAANLNNTTLRRKLLFNHDERNSATPLCSPQKQTGGQNSACLIDEGERSSPASTGPLPFDDGDDEAVFPWGVSMIRPSSRMSRSQSPLSNSYIRHSLGGKERCSSPSVFKDDAERQFSHDSRERVSPVSLRGVSPIRNIPPVACHLVPLRSSSMSNRRLSGRRISLFNSSVLSPTRDKQICQETAALEPLLVLTNEQPSRLIPFRSPQQSPVTDAAHTRCCSLNSSLLQIHCPSADTSMTQLQDISCSEIIRSCKCRTEHDEPDSGHKLCHIQNIQPSFISTCPMGCQMELVHSCPQNDDVADNFSADVLYTRCKIVNTENHSSADQCFRRVSGSQDSEELRAGSLQFGNKHETPHMKVITLCSYQKLSPQFSSSPIKGGVSSSSGYGKLNISSAEEVDNVSPRFSESPPVSPIAGRAGHSGILEEGHHRSRDISIFKLNRKLSHSDQNLIVMEDVTEDSHECHSSAFRGEVTGRKCEREDSRWKMSNDSGQMVQPFCDMDVDSQPLLEGSAVGEASCGQDTGYQTGTSSLQAINYSMQMTHSLGSQCPPPNSNESDYKNNKFNSDLILKEMHGIPQVEDTVNEEQL